MTTARAVLPDGNVIETGPSGPRLVVTEGDAHQRNKLKYYSERLARSERAFRELKASLTTGTVPYRWDESTLGPPSETGVASLESLAR